MNLTATNKGKPGINQHSHTNFRFGLHEGILTCIAVLVVWWPALFTFFSQDDFTHLLISRIDDFSDVWKFFIPVKTAIFYRPLSVQLSTWLFVYIFNLKFFWFHAVALTMHVVNVVLVYKLLSRFVKHYRLAYLGAFIYGVHPVHFMSLFWMAGFSMVLAPLFAFAAMLAFVDKKHGWFLVWFTLGLLSNELVIMVPFILMLQRKTRWLIPAFVAAGALMVLRFLLVPVSLGSEYVMSFSPVTWVINLRWQVMRSMGLPEGFRAYLNWPSIQLAVIFLSGFWAIWLSSVQIKKRILLGIGWYVLSLMPVLLLVHHQSPIYQIIGLPGFILVIMLLGEKAVESRLKFGILAGVFFVGAFWSVRAMNDYHWVTKRARIARYHIEKLQTHNPPPNSSIIFLNTVPGSSQEVYMALAGDHAVKALFGNSYQALFEDFNPGAYPPNAIYILSRTG